MSARLSILRLCRPLPRLRPRVRPGRARTERAWRERRHLRRRREVATPSAAEVAEPEPAGTG